MPGGEVGHDTGWGRCIGNSRGLVLVTAMLGSVGALKVRRHTYQRVRGTIPEGVWHPQLTHCHHKYEGRQFQPVSPPPAAVSIPFPPRYAGSRS
jgi:hypothetical protein